MQHYVFNPNGFAPKYRHPDELSARTEAERLAKLNPGQSFEVLAIVASCRMPRPEPVWSDGFNNDPVPF